MAYRTFSSATVLLLLICWLGVLSASAQTSYSTPARQRAENRKALREARRVKSPYYQSHLAGTLDAMKEGNSDVPRPLPRDGRQKYKFDHEGYARVNPPLRMLLPKYWLKWPTLTTKAKSKSKAKTKPTPTP